MQCVEGEWSTNRSGDRISAGNERQVGPPAIGTIRLRRAAAPSVRPRNQGCMVSRSWAVRISGRLGRSRGNIDEIPMTFSLKEAGGFRIGSAAMLNELPWV